ncbi:MAG: rod shape-determining protein [Lachnospiraceae bacterium]|nr:rod shape-determining protein [Lachnospiraceae bacterium]
MDASKNKECPVFGLDIGSNAVTGIVGYMDNDKFIVKAVESSLHEKPSMIDGREEDIERISATVKTVKEKLEEKCGFHLSDVCVAASGRYLKTINTFTEISFADEHTVEDEDILVLKQQSMAKAYKNLEERFEFGKKHYCVGKRVDKLYRNDSQDSDITGKEAYKIGADMTFIFLSYAVVDGLFASVSGAGLNLVDLTLEPLAAIETAVFDKFKSQNIALVDVGASASNICILNEGSVYAFGSVSDAGNSLTKVIEDFCMVEFEEAERIKKAIDNAEEVEYEDILGMSKTISRAEVLEMLETPVKNITKLVAKEIIKLNDGFNVNAVFVYGGGVITDGYTNGLEKELQTTVKNAYLRGREVMEKTYFLDKSFAKEALLVVPLGICLHYFKTGNSFVNISLNEDKIKIFDHGNVTVFDALMQIGLDNNALNPRLGDSLEFTLNGEVMSVKGGPGEACTVYLNGELSDLNAVLKEDDEIKLLPSTKGNKGEATIAKINKGNAKIGISVNNMNVNLPCTFSVNGKAVSESYKIQYGDNIEILDYITLERVMELLDKSLDDKNVTVNDEPAGPDTKVYSGYRVDF